MPPACTGRCKGAHLVQRRDAGAASEQVNAAAASFAALVAAASGTCGAVHGRLSNHCGCVCVCAHELSLQAPAVRRALSRASGHADTLSSRLWRGLPHAKRPPPR